MNAASQHGPTYAKAILHMNQATDAYNPISSPASSDITPPLTQSTSGSNNSRSNHGSISQSPPQPSTPPSRYGNTHQYHRRTATNRPRTRYPADLARSGDGRTPLHRRGTSQKYEPFEDLLREAGYKETRIFTPETERIASGAGNGDGSSGGKSKVAGVVEFLSGFIPGSRTSSLREDSKATNHSPPPSPSPVSFRDQNQNINTVQGRELQKQLIDVDATPRATRTHTSASTQPLPNTTPSAIIYTHNNHSYTSLGQSSSSKHMPPPSLPLPNDKKATYLDHRPSRATAYLRHIASAPDMPGVNLQRSHSTNASNSRTRKPNRSSRTKDSQHDNHNDDDDEDYGFNSVYEGHTRGNGEGEEDTNVPPLPKGWLETVARAILLGPGAASGTALKPPEMVTGSRVVSQPHLNSQPSSYTREMSPALRQLRQTRSVISRTGSLADAPAIHYRHRHPLSRTQSARSALSSRSGLSDRTNRTYGNWTTAMPSPLSGIKSASVDTYGLSRLRPTLMTRLDSSSRSNASDGEIRKARVLCRSAPASRATSPNPNVTNSNGRAGQRKLSDQNRKRRSRSKSKSKPHSAKAANALPSLARTIVESEGDGDTWSWLPSPNRHDLQQDLHHRSEFRSGQSSESRYLSGWGWDSNVSSALPSASQANFDIDGIGHLSISVTQTSDEADQSVSEGEDSSENEVDLAKLLRPKPQRQESSNSTNSVSSLRSIRSLRKFLVPVGSGTDGQSVPPVPPLPSRHKSGGSTRNTVDLTPPTSAIGKWFLDREDSYADGNDRYGTKSVRGKRGSLPSGWIGTAFEDEV
ncbi:hypothetical protein GGU11DRAFT_746340 [Lentinula aff. detonsa]|nr:hypothetical protein GGU11DRAFT_746340 [Lentinula aff. detonsa]